MKFLFISPGQVYIPRALITHVTIAANSESVLGHMIRTIHALNLYSRRDGLTRGGVSDRQL